LSFIGLSPRVTRLRNTAGGALTVQTDDSNSIVVSPNKSAQITVNVAAATSADVVFNGTAGITLPSGSTGQEPSSPVAGMVRYNSTTSKVEHYVNSAWRAVADESNTETLTNKALSDSTTTVVNAATSSKIVGFNLTGMAASTTLTLASAQSTSQTLNVPNVTATDTLASLGLSQTFTGTNSFNAVTIKGANLLTFNNSANTFATTFQAGANTANYAITLPIVDGSNTQVLQTNGSGVWSFVTVPTANANVAANDSNVVFTNSMNTVQVCTPTAARTYTLPTTGVSAGFTITFVNTSTTSANVITVQSSGSNTISHVFPNGKLVLTALVATPTTAANWLVVDASSTSTSYTPTITGAGTPTSISGVYRVLRDTAFFTVSFNTGTVAAALASISLPTSININVNGLTINNSTAADGNVVGLYSQSTNNANGYILAAPATSTSLVYAGQLPSSAGDPLLPRSGNTIWNTSALTVIQFSVPIS
jgi:hypothetical protein